MQQFKSDVEAIDSMAVTYKNLKQEVGKVIIGQDDVVKKVLLCIFCDAHALLVGVPGLAKTLLVKTIADVLNLSFKRIQFTPDLMPSDITGAEILDEQRQFRFTRGPLFANILLADEINRTPPKTQSALLEAMQERSITVGGHLHQLDLPFFVLATQNPIEQEGTYPLPEAQLDRFMLNIKVDYPSFEEEVNVVKSTTAVRDVVLKKSLSADEIRFFQHLVRKVPIADNVLQYAVKLASKTRPGTTLATKEINEYISWGAGPRASQFLVIGAKANAALNGKYSPDMEDVQAVAEDVLRHRLVKNYKAEAEGIAIEDIIRRLL
ncbi:MAG: MoxR family ATPase [Sphingobacteriales bacterium]|nr:MAG: MoxR family ATPase [Sphingobacteriales bacterium]